MYYPFIYLCLKLTPCCAAQRQKQKFPQVINTTAPRFMERQCSSLFSTEPTTCTYPEPAETNPRKHTRFLSD